VFRFIFKTLRLGFLAALGTALVAKFMLKSNAEPKTQEVDMVSIFGGEHLKSTAKPFYGGKILTMFGGTLLDLREATPAPTGVYIDLAVVFGGVELTVPKGWRVEFTGKVVEPATPTVHIGGFIVMAGGRVTNRTSAEVAA
jgi:hypothetical protein